jgi:hypothetical protein
LPRDIATFLKFRKNIANLVVILEASVLSPLKKKEIRSKRYQSKRDEVNRKIQKRE